MDDSPGEEHVAFMQWAVSNGVKIKGITPARFPGRRLGMMATRAIEKNEIMLTVPLALMVTIDSIPPSFVSSFPDGTSIHGILAAFLTHGEPELLKSLDPWRRVWPSWAEFEESMPVFWPAGLRASNSAFQEGRDQEALTLPPSVSGRWNSFVKEEVGVDYETRYQNLLAQQEKRLQEAWMRVITVFPEMEWKKFAYNWAIINSRSFYYISPGEEEPEDWNDAIAMVPFADYFNHVDDAACAVKFDGKKYTFKATRRYEKGEEVFMSYGSHSNDFLLVEYGFCLDDNPSDSIYLDDIIFPELTRAEKKELITQECFGNYEITAAGPDSNATVVACLKYMSRKDWREYVAGTSQRGFDATKTTAIIRAWIEKYIQECEVTTKVVTDMLESSREAKSSKAREKIDLTLSRWRQIRTLCESALQAAGSWKE